MSSIRPEDRWVRPTKGNDVRELLEHWPRGTVAVDADGDHWRLRPEDDALEISCVSSYPKDSSWDLTELYPYTYRPFEILAPQVPEAPKAESKVEAEAKVKHKKPRMSLLPWDALLWVAKVLTKGAEKYADESWKSPPFIQEDYDSAMGRHRAAIARGERVDPESGYPHWAHIACNAVMALWYEIQKPEYKDK